MVVLLRIFYFKDDGHVRIKAGHLGAFRVRLNFECKPVNTRINLSFFGKQVRNSSIGIRRSSCQFVPTLSGLEFQYGGDAVGRPSFGDVEYMRGYGAHGCSFSILNCVIFLCSSRQIESSTSGELPSRTSRMDSISSAV